MADSTTFSSRSNAKRAADTAIGKGTAPNVDYNIHARDDGRFEIVWLTRGIPQEAPPTTDEVAAEIATATEEADGVTPVAHAPKDKPAELPDPFPPGTRVLVSMPGQIIKKHFQSGTVERRIGGSRWEVVLDVTGARDVYTGGQLSLLEKEPTAPASDAPPRPSTAKIGKTDRKPRAAPSGDRKPSKSAELDAAAARGVMPTKPIMTSPTNKAQYQPRFDKLEAMATAGDWDGVRGYEVKGINSYAKMVVAYRDRLLAAHAAQQGATEGEAA